MAAEVEQCTVRHREAQQLQKDSGWDIVRVALSSTVRLWIMTAVVGRSVANELVAALDFWNRAIEVVTWGLTAWKDVPPEKRGRMFSGTFLVGLKNLRLERLLMVHSQYPEHAPLNHIHDAACELVELTDQLEEPTNTEPGVVLSFFVYPKAHASAALGLYYRDLAEVYERSDAKRAVLPQVGSCVQEGCLIIPQRRRIPLL
ncbi:hypothetical protein PHLGIDRAFT_375478 [Phlebiopsis gigantea 11061_1 CR5-6]|uniref:Uncharacterized protein n=1 Tax=Phlebiopsis gigantea (strain 11061_1 CR5-6) TaxID=745531 RepID=A0A0C3S9R0_PHLG1|nr:hypothetical protein PHLGIDRAFT_375478 [Phlebiopsis gigantea 11061_1 CR5-6]